MPRIDPRTDIIIKRIKKIILDKSIPFKKMLTIKKINDHIDAYFNPSI